MFMEERQKDIVRRLNETGRIIVSEIQEIYGVSADCARRDLRNWKEKDCSGGPMAGLCRRSRKAFTRRKPIPQKICRR